MSTLVILIPKWLQLCINAEISTTELQRSPNDFLTLLDETHHYLKKFGWTDSLVIILHGIGVVLAMNNDAFSKPIVDFSFELLMKSLTSQTSARELLLLVLRKNTSSEKLLDYLKQPFTALITNAMKTSTSDINQSLLSLQILVTSLKFHE